MKKVLNRGSIKKTALIIILKRFFLYLYPKQLFYE